MFLGKVETILSRPVLGEIRQKYGRYLPTDAQDGMQAASLLQAAYNVMRDL
ncbi:MAG: hypothetical protein H0T64_10615 [Pyrinomonadaceae bacterium]|nr:hypothetical protein [Pyrinomonadaceae bacterium]